MQYKEYSISEPLRPFVKVIWSMDSDVVMLDAPIRILPDTCVELVLHYKDPFQTTFSDNSVSIQEQSLVVAQMKSFMEIMPAGKIGFFAVRFSAQGAYHFFNIPMREITNRETGLSYLWKGLALEIEDKLFSAKSNEQRSEIIQNYLRVQLSRNGYIDKTIDFCLAEISNTKGQITMEDLADKTGISNRQLVRRFDKCIGLSPKEFARITKFISSLNAIKSSKSKSFTHIAYETGYYDQAHFIHDFKEFSGMTPSEYISSNNVVY